MIDYRMADATVYCGLSGYAAASLLWVIRRRYERTHSGAMMTQRRRYAQALLAQSMAVVSIIWLWIVGTPGDVVQAVKGWFVLVGPIVDGIIVGGLLCDVLILLTIGRVLGYIYHHPVQMAYKCACCGLYCTTLSYRRGAREFVMPVSPIEQSDLFAEAINDFPPD